jgi:hypothetical protein
MVNTDKARHLLGFEPKVNLLEGIERVAQWFRENESFIPAAVPNQDAGFSPLPLSLEDSFETFTETPSSTASELTSSVIAIPEWIRGLAQAQWILIVLFVVWKAASLRQPPSPRSGNFSRSE